MSQEITQIVLRVNGEDALKKVQQYEAAIKRCNKEKAELDKKYSGGGTWSKEDIKHYRDLDKELKTAQKSLARTEATAQQVGRVMDNISGASIPELTKSLRALEHAQKQVTRGTKEWDEVCEAIAAVKQELKNIKAETEAAADVPMFNNFQEFASNAETAISAIKSNFAVIQGLVDEYAEAAEHMAAVSKYTGLTEEEVRALNEDFAKIDTKTSRAALNDLAADAGRLGLQGRDAILDFVQAADTINVALGEDLGEGAVKDIGKLAALFGDDQKMGLKGAMLATASTINELAQTSSAAEGYIMEFTSRLGGVAVQAGLTQADVMAMAAVMDQAKVNAEEGSTALSRLLQILYKEPEKVARVMKLDVLEFTNLLKTDANAALMQFLQAANNLGGMERLAPALGELSLTGAGVTKTIAALASNIDNLRETQVQAALAFNDATSATNEAAVANNTVAARIEKQRQQFALLRQELGRQLLPVMNKTFECLVLISQFAVKNAAVIAPLIVAFLALKTAIAAQTFATQVATLAAKAWQTAVLTWNAVTYAATIGVKSLTVAVRALNTAFKGNPVLLVVSAITALIAVVGGAAMALYNMATAEDKNAAALERRAKGIDRVKAAQDKAKNATADEIARIESLRAAANDLTASYDTRKKAMDNLARIIPGFNAAQSLEKGINDANARSIDAYIKKLQEKALAEAYYEQYREALAKRARAEIEVYKKANNVAAVDRELANNPERYKGVSTQTGNWGAVGIGGDKRRKDKEAERAKQVNALKGAQADLAAADNELKAITAAVKANKDVTGLFQSLMAGGADSGVNDLKVPNNLNGDSPSTRHSSLVTNNSQKPDPAAEIRDRANRELVAARLSYQAGLTTYLEYETAEKDILYRSITERLALAKEGTKEYADLQKEQSDYNEKYAQTAAARSKQQIESDYQAALAVAQAKHAQGITDNETYQSRLDMIERIHLKQRLDYAKKYSSQKDIQDAELKQQQHAYTLQLKTRERLMKSLKDITDKYNVDIAAGAAKAAISFEDQIKEATRLMQELGIAAEEQTRIIEAMKEAQKDAEMQNAPGTNRTDLGAPSDTFSSSIIRFSSSIVDLTNKIKDGKAEWQDYAMVACSALGVVASTMQAVSDLFSAKQQEEAAAVNQKYDEQIKAAGENSELAKQLDEQRKKELQKIQQKYADKEMKVKIGMAVAQTAQNAIMAYGSMASIPVVGPALGAIAAAAAIAAGAIQIAVIKKQAEATKAGYYEGGYTGGRRYRREAGVVHEGEFVANHLAVENPNLRPVLNMIDAAQRGNRVSSLSAADVSRTVGTPALTIVPAVNDTAAAAAAPSASATAAASTAAAAAASITPAIDRLNDILSDGIRSTVAIDGRDGVAYNLNRYNNLMK